MLSNREKEIIRNVYMDILKQIYSSSGPSYLSSEDHKELSSFLRELQKDDNFSISNLSYHLSCDNCNKIWWMDDGFPAYCPFCGNKRFTINSIVKDCTTCEYGKYNDRYKTYFCYNNKKDCKEWNLWEEKRTCYNCKNRVYDLFDGDAFCPIAKDCKNKSKWEGK